MRVAVNGWFWHQIATGSGQYLATLVEWLPRTANGHAYHIVAPAGEPVVAAPPWQVTPVTTPFDRGSRNVAKLSVRAGKLPCRLSPPARRRGANPLFGRGMVAALSHCRHHSRPDPHALAALPRRGRAAGLHVAGGAYSAAAPKPS